MDRDNYLSAKQNGVEDRLRGDAISRGIAKEIPLSEQVAIMRKQLYAVVAVLEAETGKSILTDNFKRLYALAEAQIDAVDAVINELEASINEDTET